MTTDIHSAIASEGYSPRVLELIDNYAKDIENGRANFSRYTLPEHAGLCTAGKVLIGASVVADYARGSLTAGSDAAGGPGCCPNWQIDEAQEHAIEQWARAARLWVDDSDAILERTYGPMIAQGAEAKVYYRTGDTSVVKERTSIYSVWQKALEDMHPANVFIDEITGLPICIDCIVKFV